MTSRRCWAISILTALIVGLVATAGFAAESTGGAKTSVLSDMFGGGFFGGAIMVTLFLLSMADMALIIEHFVAISREKLLPEALAREVDGLLAKGEATEALEVLNSEPPSFLCNVLRAGLSDLRSGYDAMFESMQSAGEEETTKLHRKIEYLSLIGNIAPMLGLFGTVFGMIMAFKRIALVGNPSPSDLAQGIYTALYTTLIGLLIAMPTMAVYTFFQNRIVSISLEIGGIAEEIIRRFKPKGQ